jgi:hypothetical protein
MSRQQQSSPRLLQAFTKMVGTPIHYVGQPYVEYDPNDLHRVFERLPRIETFTRPKLTFIYDTSDDTDETLSLPSIDGWYTKRAPFEYRITGVTWHTPKYLNSCHIDNFLAAWVRKSRQTHGEFIIFYITFFKLMIFSFQE